MPLPVIAAIIVKKEQILLCQRKEGALAGKWEFPGGKLEDGETPEECLVREIREELDLEIRVNQIYKAVHTHYDHGDFLIVGYLAEPLSGKIKLRVHADYAWVDYHRLIEYDLAEANIPIAASLKKEPQSPWSRMRADSRAD
ncbi:MAG: (deoxy)nucleoside triphosphate pyrophosphohydrolase [Firmicutes bacterium]|nr:(deoxy)nucleoside triphosphate pyrophosphohydrolase [Bacillota bacterium]